MNTVDVIVERLPHGEGLALPQYETADAAGMDLQAAVQETLIIEPGARALIPTGLKIALPSGYEAQVRARSGLALKYGIMVPNAPGTIDADYRGEVGVILLNAGQAAFAVERGMRIAQLVFAPVTRGIWQEDVVGQTRRGAGGFGSTGTGAG